MFLGNFGFICNISLFYLFIINFILISFFIPLFVYYLLLCCIFLHDLFPASSCPRIRRNKNLRLKYRSNKRIVYFACRSGFEIIGATSAICNENTWSTDFPICVGKFKNCNIYNTTVITIGNRVFVDINICGHRKHCIFLLRSLYIGHKRIKESGGEEKTALPCSFAHDQCYLWL